MKLNANNQYKSVFVTIKLTAEGNKLLSESCERSNRKKLQEAALRLEDHLMRFRAISEKGLTVYGKYENDTNSLSVKK
ncbi:TPA: TraY domain-containing protein [Legionella pneumophila]